MAHETTKSSSKKSAKTKSTYRAVTSSKPVSAAMEVVTTLKSMPIVGTIVSEFIGVFLLVVSLMVILLMPISAIFTSMFLGLAIIGIVLLVSGKTTAHLNPAVTVGALVTRKLSLVTATGAILAQILGAIAAWFVLDKFFQGSGIALEAGYGDFSLVHAGVIPETKEWFVFFTELLGTMVLSMGIAAALRNKKDKLAGAFSYGLAVFVGMVIALGSTSLLLPESYTTLTFLNPAVIVAANGLSWATWPIAIYIAAPVLGGIFGFVVYEFIQSQPVEE